MPLASAPPQGIDSNHNTVKGNDLTILFVKEPYDTNNTDTSETMSTQSDEATPYMLDSEQESDYNNGFSAGNDSTLDQQRSYTTKSDRAINIPKHLKNFEL